MQLQCGIFRNPRLVLISATPVPTWIKPKIIEDHSGKIKIQTWNILESPFVMGKSTKSMAVFHCYVSSPEGIPKLFVAISNGKRGWQNRGNLLTELREFMSSDPRQRRRAVYPWPLVDVRMEWIKTQYKSYHITIYSHITHINHTILLYYIALLQNIFWG